MSVKCFLVRQLPEWPPVMFEDVSTGERFSGYRPGMMFFDEPIEAFMAQCEAEGKPYPFAHCYHRGPDGRVLNVICPNGLFWCIDSRANNCTRKLEPHSCWCRHGEAPNITVNKDGDTCGCGHSIQTHSCGDIPSYHGFLENGIFRDL